MLYLYTILTGISSFRVEFIHEKKERYQGKAGEFCQASKGNNTVSVTKL